MTPGSNPSTKRWRIVELIQWGEDYLSRRGFDHPRREIEWMLTDLLCLSRVDLYLKFDHPVDQTHLDTLRSWIKRRLKGEPLAYITGKVEFFGLPFKVSPDVLIPRPETERLVEIALDKARDTGARDIVDIGTGSGCIAIALGCQMKRARIVAIDRDPETLAIASKNAHLNGVDSRITFQEADVRTDTIRDHFDLLVSNPPYIPENEMDQLADEVKRYEPVRSLTDGGNGLEFYRRYAKQASTWVRPGGFVVVEVGLGSHPARVRNVFDNEGLHNIQVFQDYNGDDRVMTVEITG